MYLLHKKRIHQRYFDKLGKVTFIPCQFHMDDLCTLSVHIYKRFYIPGSVNAVIGSLFVSNLIVIQLDTRNYIVTGPHGRCSE